MWFYLAQGRVFCFEPLGSMNGGVLLKNDFAPWIFSTLV
jgi:hypothetical protein